MTAAGKQYDERGVYIGFLYRQTFSSGRAVWRAEDRHGMRHVQPTADEARAWLERRAAWNAEWRAA